MENKNYNTKIKMQFDPKVAGEIGVEEAIMLSNIEFWVEHNKANEKNFYDKHYWTYNSQNAFEKLFTFWSRRQIQRILKNLEDKGYIKTSSYNKHKYDRTKWYTCIEPNGSKPGTKQCDGLNQRGGPIPYDKPDSKQQISFDKGEKERKDQDIIDLLESFKDINPSYKKFFSNTTQRKASERMIKEHGLDNLLGVIKILPETNAKQYAPTITTPLQLEDKMGQLMAFLKKKDDKNDTIIL